MDGAAKTGELEIKRGKEGFRGEEERVIDCFGSEQRKQA